MVIIHFPCTLYRHFNSSGVLLYVGVSEKALARLQEHSRKSEWYQDITTITLQHFPTRREAETAELEAIKTENPLYNKHFIRGNRRGAILKDRQFLSSSPVNVPDTNSINRRYNRLRRQLYLENKHLTIGTD
jgi:hypothetical protein